MIDEHLRLYAQRGWRCVPILPGTKRPAWNDWPRRATTDLDTLEAWWEAHPLHGIGIATGRESGIWVLDVDPRNGGDETLHELESTHGSLAEHYEILTGGGGRHIYFTYPPGPGTPHPVDGGLAGGVEEPTAGYTVHPGILGPGLDIKSDGGQVLAPPTLHPETGRRYELELGGAQVPLPTPAWLLGLVGDDARRPVAEEAVPREELALSPLAWDRYNASASNALTAGLMEEMGWTILGVDRRGVISLQRPDLYEGEGKEGVSMTVGAITGAPGVAYCWTSSVPGWQSEYPYDAATILARARFAGDEAACDAWLAESRWGIRSRWDDPQARLEQWLAEGRRDDDEDPWADLDVMQALAGAPVTPSIVHRSDGYEMLYPATLHWVTGEPESSKTWLALHAVAQVLSWGGHVMYFDYENGLPLLERCLALGIPRAQLIRQMHVKSMPPSWNDKVVLARLIDEVRGNGIRLVVIDSCSSCMASAGLDPLDNASVLHFVDFARRMTVGGASSVVLDHLNKGDTATQKYPMGATQKYAQASVAIGVQPRVKPAPGTKGVSALYIHKDRHGQLYRIAEKVGEYDMLGAFVLDSKSTDEVEATIRPYSQAGYQVESAPIRPKPWNVMQAVTDVLTDGGDMRLEWITTMIMAERGIVRLAAVELERRGYITVVESSPLTYRILRPYRSAQDPESPYYVPDEEALT